MLPDNTLSAAPVPSHFIGAAAAGGDSLTAYADGGVALNDPSQGLTGQLWRARVVGGQVVLDSPTHPASIVLDANPTHISIAFDRNMALLIAWVEGGLAFLRWTDPLTGELAAVELGGVITPRLALDDARPTGATTSDVILAYIRDGGLYHRRQRDRFEVEIPLDDGPFISLLMVGHSSNLRFQFETQFGDDSAPNIIQRLTSTMLSPISDLQQGMFNMLNYRGISSAYAAQLDMIGKILVLDRKGVGDDVYRRALYLKAATNNNEGSPNEILTATKLVTNGTRADIWEYSPACVFLYTNGAESDVIISRNRIGQLIPVGVDGPYILHSENADAFTPVEYDNSLLLDASQYLPEHTEVSPTFGELVELHTTTEE